MASSGRVVSFRGVEAGSGSVDAILLLDARVPNDPPQCMKPEILSSASFIYPLPLVINKTVSF